MINLAFVIDTIASPTAGTERQLLLLIRHLDRRRFTPYLCVLQSSPWLEQGFSDCELFCAEIGSFKRWRDWQGVGRLRSFFQQRRIDVVQVHFRDASLAGILAGRWARLPGVVATRRNQGYWMNRTEVFLQKMLNRWVDVVVANSQATAEWVLENEGLSRQRLEVIYNGLALGGAADHQPQWRRQVRREFGIPPQTAVVGVVANLRPVKGLATFLRAAARVLASGADACFLLIGQGEERPRLEELARKLGITAQVRFLGRREDVPRLLTAFDVGVLSSRSESFSNAVIEYLAAGLPVVCTSVGGVGEVVREGVSGHLVPPGDDAAMAAAILRVLRNRKEYSLAGSQKWLRDHCSVETMVARHQELYARLAGACPPGGLVAR